MPVRPQLLPTHPETLLSKRIKPVVSSNVLNEACLTAENDSAATMCPIHDTRQLAHGFPMYSTIICGQRPWASIFALRLPPRPCGPSTRPAAWTTTSPTPTKRSWVPGAEICARNLPSPYAQNDSKQKQHKTHPPHLTLPAKQRV